MGQLDTMRLQTCTILLCIISIVSSDTTSSPSCLPGWLQATEGCFLFMAEDANLTWAEAMSACEDAGGYLAEPKTQKQMNFLAGVAALEMDFYGVANWWLGLTDLGHEGRWVWSHSVEQVSETFWSPKSPSDKPGNHLDCGFAALSNNQLLWTDKDCGEVVANGHAPSPICQYGELDTDTSTTSTPEQTTTTSITTGTSPPTTTITSSKPEGCPPSWSSYEDRCYWVIETEMTWPDARGGCQALGADLASSHSDQMEAFIHDMLDGQVVTTWLGGTDSAEEGTWVWVDGTEFDFSYWYSGEGNDGTAQNCLAYHIEWWWDYGCFEQHWAICSKRI